jgi:FKBP-type peptidyl-prolyl cis-trans isomerase FkpA
MLRSLMMCSLVCLLGCGGEPTPGGQTSGDPTKVTYAPELGVDLTRMERRESGLYVEELQPGTGDAASVGRPVTVHYTGWLPSGAQFDSSRARSPYSFTLGRGTVIAGWDEGLVGMKVGGVRKLVIPSSLAYGETGNRSIPPNSVLIFDVELISVP